MEIWKDIEGYKGFYQVSSLGRIKSLAREKILYHGGIYNTKEEMLTLCLTKKGYLRTYLYQNGKRETFSVHRLVLKTFVDNPFSKPEVNHKNGKKDDNRLENLEWATSSENVKHSFKELGKKFPKGKDNKKSREIMQVSVDGFLLNVFSSRREAAMETKSSHGNISSCISGRRNKAGGYLWF